MPPRQPYLQNDLDDALGSYFSFERRSRTDLSTVMNFTHVIPGSVRSLLCYDAYFLDDSADFGSLSVPGSVRLCIVRGPLIADEEFEASALAHMDKFSRLGAVALGVFRQSSYCSKLCPSNSKRTHARSIYRVP